MSISGTSYIRFLEAIQNITTESNLPISNQEQLEVCTTPGAKEALKASPGFSLEQVIEKVSTFLNDKQALVAFLAAEKAELKDLSLTYLKSWIASLEKKLKNKDCKTLQDLDDKVSKIAKSLVWPVHLNASHETLLQSTVSHLLAREIVFRHFHPEPSTKLPPHINFLATTNPDGAQQYLLSKYSPLVTTIKLDELVERDPCFSFGNFGGLLGSVSSLQFYQSITDDKLAKYLQRFPNADTLDLSNCLLITEKGLIKANGHNKVHTVILRNCSIPKAAITKSLFPNLQTILEENPVKVYHANFDSRKTGYKQLPAWKEILADFKQADKIYNLNLRDISTKFEESPSLEALDAIIYLKDHLPKCSSPIVPSFSKENFYAAMIPVVLHAWLNLPYGTSNPKLEKNLLNFVLQGYLETKEIKQWKELVCTTFYNLLTYKGNGSVETHIQKTKQLLPLLLEHSLIVFPTLFDALKKEIATEDTTLFRNLHPFKRYETLSEVERLRFLREMYVHLSHQATPLEEGPFTHLRDPFKQKIVTSAVYRRNQNDSLLFFFFLGSTLITPEKTELPGPAYAFPMDHTLACAFAVKTSTIKERESLLSSILNNLADYKNQTGHYALSKIILGLTEEIDIPEKARNGFLKPLLLAYKGIFQENIEESLKIGFLHALFAHRFGELTEMHIDALIALHKQTPSLNLKKEIVKGLESLAGIKHGFISNIAYHVPNAFRSPFQISISEKLATLN